MKYRNILIVLLLLTGGMASAQVTIKGNVYGGGKLGIVTSNTSVNINNGTTKGSVFGGGMGVNTDETAGCVQGNATVTMTGGQVESSIYGGGELGSVGTFTDHQTVPYTSGTFAGESVDVPTACQEGTGITKVVLSGGKVGIDHPLMPDPEHPSSEDVCGYVFCGGQGEADSINYYKAVAMGVVDSTYLEISNDVVISASVYGGCENGLVLRNTHVKIQGGQIGIGYNKKTNQWDGAYTADQWTTAIDKIRNEEFTDADAAGFHECDAWPYKAPYAVFDPNANDYASGGGAVHATNGHSFFGNVFGGGSGYYPIAAGIWRRTAGRVGNNTFVEITGGHILTSVYGGNEYTDVVGKSTVHMSGGTVGVPRALDSIKHHPVSCYLYGAGMGDPRLWANTWTTVNEVEVKVTGGTIFGSVFGGGEDGHVIGDANVTIEGDNTLIGTFGHSYVDGNVFGSGRGFTGIALTAGNVGGNVYVDIKGGKMLGSIYGGGRLGSVGYELASATVGNNRNPRYGLMQDGADHGIVTVNITGGIIGNDYESKLQLLDHTRGGNVFAGSMGRLEGLDGTTINSNWPNLARVKKSILNISGDATVIKGNVYGGCELGTVTDSTRITITGGTIWHDVFGSGYGSDNNTTENTFYYTDGTTITETTVTPMEWAGRVEGNTKLMVKGGWIKKSVYGGGELASVGTVTNAVEHTNSNSVFALSWPYDFTYQDNTGKTELLITGGRVGITGKDFMGPWDADGHPLIKLEGASNYVVYDNTNEDHKKALKDARQDNGDIYGGSKGKAGDSHAMAKLANVNKAVVLINYASTPSATNYKPDDWVYDFQANTAAFTYSSVGCLTGAVYGGGENGHVNDSTSITLTEGLIGHAMYGGGKGKDEYIDSDNNKVYSITAGKVYGNTHIHINGGLVVRNVFGGGNLASVGKGNYLGKEGGVNFGEVAGSASDWSTAKNSGHTYIDITAGQLGILPTNLKKPDDVFKDGIPYGSVFGGCRGMAQNTSDYNGDRFGYVNHTHVTIGTKGAATGPRLYGSVFGGGQDGHVRWDANTVVYSGNIGADYGTDDVAHDSENNPITDVNSKFWVARGNVFGGGSGIGLYDEDDDDSYSPIAGSVNQFVNVNIVGGTIHRNVYGGGNLASVGIPYENHVKDSTCINLNVKVGIGQNTTAGYGGNVFGASRGRQQNDATTYAQCSYTDVNIDSLANIPYHVYGGGELGGVKRDTRVDIASANCTGHNENIHGYVYGGGKGDLTNKDFGWVKGNTLVNISGGTVAGSVFGGGELATVGQVTTGGALVANTGLTQIIMTNGTIGNDTLYGDAYPATFDEGHIFGAGKGVADEGHKQFCNVNTTKITLSGGNVYGTVYGGSADGHVLGNDSIFIHQGASIGTSGLSGYDGSVFGGGKGSGEDSGSGFQMFKTCGRVAGNTYVKMDGGSLMGCIYGGGRLALTGVDEEGNASFIDPNDVSGTRYDSINHGLALIDVRGESVIGIDDAFELLDSDYSVGDIFGGGQGDYDNYEDPLAGCVANAIVNVAGNSTVYCTVFGGGEIAGVGYKNNGEFLKGTGTTRDTIAGTATIGSDFEFHNHKYQMDPTDWTMFDTVNSVRRLQHTCSGNVFGAGQGDASPNYPSWIYLSHSRTAEVVVKDNPTILGSVFGGSEQGIVTENTYVKIKGGTIGTTGIKADSLKYENGSWTFVDSTALYSYGSVFGGGFGVDSLQYGANDNDLDTFPNVIAGRVYGNTFVDITGGTIRGNVYGGGNLASVGDVENDGSLSQGKCFVTVSGGTIGDQDGTGMNANVFGGGRGFPVDSIHTRNPYANVNSTEVTVSGGFVKGNVYGGGAYSHVLDSTDVIITQDALIGTTGFGRYDGSVFGGGRGNLFNFAAGRVAGNTQVVMNHGTVLGNVYGGGLVALVGANVDGIGADATHPAFIDPLDPTRYDSIHHGLAKVEVSGGIIGNYVNDGLDLLRSEYQVGCVYGGGRGNIDEYHEDDLARTANAIVNISGTPTIYGNVFGGGQTANVGYWIGYDDGWYSKGTGATHVTIKDTPTIGTAKEFDHGYSTATNPAPKTQYDTINEVRRINHTLTGNVFAGGQGRVKYEQNKLGGFEQGHCRTAEVNIHMDDDNTGGHIMGSVFGGSEQGAVWGDTKVTVSGGTIGTSGVVSDSVNVTEPYTHATYNYGSVFGGSYGADFYRTLHLTNPTQNVMDSVNSLVGRVYGNATVAITGGTILENVYGGGNMASVGEVKNDGTLVNGLCTVTIGGTATIGDLDGTGLNADVYGAGKGFGNDRNGKRKAYANVHNTSVTVNGGAVKGDVYGGSAYGHVLANTDVTIKSGANIGTDGITNYDGNVFGGGKGDGYYTITDPGTPDADTTFHLIPTSGRVAGNTSITMTGGSTKASLFGGGRLALVGVDVDALFDAFLTGQVYDSTHHGLATITLSGGTVGTDNVEKLLQCDYSVGDVFGSGKGDILDYQSVEAGRVANAIIDISEAPEIRGCVFGGGEMAGIGYWDVTGSNAGVFKGMTGSAKVTIDGTPSIGSTGELSYTSSNTPGQWTMFDETTGKIFHTCTGNVFGGSQGDVDTTCSAWVSMARSREAVVEIKGGSIMGSVFGGSEQGTVAGNTKVSVSGGTIGSLINQGSGATTPYYLGDIYGAGYGSDDSKEDISTAENDSTLVRQALGLEWTPAVLAGRVYGNSRVDFTGGKVVGSVYGGGERAYVGYEPYTGHDGRGKSEVNVNFTYAANTNKIAEHVYGANNYMGGPYDNAKVNVVKGTLHNVFGGGNVADCPGTTDVILNPSALADITIDTLFGGGNLASTGAATINMNNGTVLKGVYGGCNASDNVNGDIVVNIKGGVVGTNSNRANVHGGGFGQNTGSTGNITVTVGDQNNLKTAAAPVLWGDLYGGSALGTVNDAGSDITTVNLIDGTLNGSLYGGGLGDSIYYGGQANVRAIVNGQVVVNVGQLVPKALDPTKYDTIGNAVITGDIYGCNNLNGTPKDNVNVNIYKTAHGLDPEHNLYPANVDWTVNGALAGNTAIQTYAIRSVYGGGNKASYIPAVADKSSTVHVYTCVNTIEDVYGGSNAAHVGSNTVTTNTNLIVDGGRIKRVFGGGNGETVAADIHGTATTEVHGGVINEVFGGSNTAGAINSTSLSVADQGAACDLFVGSIFGGGNNAIIFGDGELIIACGAGTFDEVYGGSNLADIGDADHLSNVTLTVRGGTINKVYGGSKGRLADPDQGIQAKAANIYGNVTLNLEGGTIGNAYGGSNINGNIHGKITVKVEDIENSTCPLQVDTIFGASNATPYTPDLVGGKTPISPEVNVKHIKTNSINGCVFGGGCGTEAVVTANPKVTIGDADNANHTITIDENVYGGGNRAQVIGNTHVILDGTSKVDIKGNVFGAGHGANVQGNAKVEIKEPTTPQP